jgi:PadR family transcriptional regulator PadR
MTLVDGGRCEKMNNLEEIVQDLNELGEEEYKKFVDKIVKANREIIVLSILTDKPMCGYDLIKEIFSRCNVFLSQGTVYPILYSLEEEGVLRAEFGRGNMRTKKYFVTPKGKEVVQKKLDGFVKAIEYILLFVKRDE